MTHARTFTAAFLALSIAGYSGAQTVRCTTWNLQWFPSGSAKEASAEQQNQRIKEAADVLRAINPDIVLLQEVRDYDVCARLADAISPKQIFIKLDAAAILRGDGAALRNQTTDLHVVVRGKTSSSPSTGLQRQWTISQDMRTGRSRSCCAISASG